MSYNPIVVTLSSLKPFFFNGLKKELCFSDHAWSIRPRNPIRASSLSSWDWYRELDSGEFCEWPKLNTRGYLCTLGVPTHSIHQKGYPLAQAPCTAFAHTPGLFVWFAPTSEQATMATCAAPRRCADRLGNTA